MDTASLYRYRGAVELVDLGVSNSVARQHHETLHRQVTYKGVLAV